LPADSIVDGSAGALGVPTYLLSCIAQ
jgi:hypothetical protein